MHSHQQGNYLALVQVQSLNSTWIDHEHGADSVVFWSRAIFVPGQRPCYLYQIVPTLGVCQPLCCVRKPSVILIGDSAACVELHGSSLVPGARALYLYLVTLPEKLVQNRCSNKQAPQSDKACSVRRPNTGSFVH